MYQNFPENGGAATVPTGLPNGAPISASNADQTPAAAGVAADQHEIAHAMQEMHLVDDSNPMAVVNGLNPYYFPGVDPGYPQYFAAVPMPVELVGMSPVGMTPSGLQPMQVPGYYAMPSMDGGDGQISYTYYPPHEMMAVPMMDQWYWDDTRGGGQNDRGSVGHWAGGRADRGPSTYVRKSDMNKRFGGRARGRGGGSCGAVEDSHPGASL